MKNEISENSDGELSHKKNIDETCHFSCKFCKKSNERLFCTACKTDRLFIPSYNDHY